MAQTHPFLVVKFYQCFLAMYRRPWKLGSQLPDESVLFLRLGFPSHLGTIFLGRLNEVLHRKWQSEHLWAKVFDRISE